MRKLYPLKKQTLDILKHLEYRCERLGEKRCNESEVEIMASDIDWSIFDKTEELYDVALYLQDRKLDFSVTCDLINPSPDPEDSIVGIIKGKNIPHIVAKIKELINELNSNEPIKNANEKGLTSIHLVTESVAVKDVIFMVIDGRYENPIRFDIKNQDEEDSSVKKLHNIAYCANAPGKRVDYNERTADGINNGLFKREAIRKYMTANKLKKPTLVQKSESENGEILVLKGDVPVNNILIRDVPSQYLPLYKDKTR